MMAMSSHLAYFQQLIELQESATMLEELGKTNRLQSLQELKSTLISWRERLLNKWDDVYV